MSEEANARISVGSKWVPVIRVDVEDANANHHQNDDQLHAYHDCVEGCTLFDSFDEYDRQDESDHDSRQVEVRSRRNETCCWAPGPDTDAIVVWRSVNSVRNFKAEQW